MTKEEVRKKIEELEEKKFMIDMIDSWDDNDKKRHREITIEIIKLQEELEKMEAE